LNEARHPDLAYPPNRSKSGIDYSYGIGLPLSAGGWVRQGAGSDPTDDRPRRFVDHESRPSERVLVGDAYESYIYNLSGNALRSNIWNDPTQFDNTVAWRRHTIGGPRRLGANVLFQDGHASIVEFHTDRPDPVNTARVFVWHPGESLNLNPDSRSGENYYPNRVPPSFLDGSGDVFPRELLPFWYSRTQGWTLIPHK
jgi:prepilin-type processing-associated H-X9-DG protein